MLDLIVIRWNDAWADAVTSVTLRDVSDTHLPEPIETIGWLLREDEDGVSIANELCSDGSFRGRSFIPKAMIQDITHFELKKPRKPKPPKEAINTEAPTAI